MNEGLNVDHVRLMVVRPALNAIDLWTQAAENLVLGTFMKESELRSLRQVPAGPALGLAQFESATHHSMWVHSIPGIQGMMLKLWRLLRVCDITDDPWPSDEALVTNLLYAAAMCRLRYYIAPERLPLENDPMAMAQYWLKYYNAGGKGTVEAALPHFKRACKLS